MAKVKKVICDKCQKLMNPGKVHAEIVGSRGVLHYCKVCYQEFMKDYRQVKKLKKG